MADMEKFYDDLITINLYEMNTILGDTNSMIHTVNQSRTKYIGHASWHNFVKRNQFL